MGRTDRLGARWLSMCIVLVVASVASACRDAGGEGSREPLQLESPPANAPASVAAVSSYADVVARVTPAVVTIRSARRVRAPRQHPFMDDPWFREWFGDRVPQSGGSPRGTVFGLGSGVIVTADGFVVTNHHVVDGAEEITVDLTDRRSFPARVVGSDPPSDLALLKVEAQNLPMLQLGDSDRVRVGDVAIAVGNPLGVGQTVTAGIISAKGRTTGLSDGSFEDFLQTDAPINQGNSGGALVNTAGELVGINSQILSTSGGNIGIGFAIPSNMARNVMEQLAATGRVRRAQLGVTLGPPPTPAEGGGAPAVGVTVASVLPGSAADRAGFEPGDVIVAFDGQEVAEPNALRNRIASTAPGTQVTITVLRGSERIDLPVTLDEYEARRG